MISEYDAFGPWIYEIDEEHPLPELFEPYVVREGAITLMKIPRQIERRNASPDMQLYDYVIGAYKNRVSIFKRIENSMQVILSLNFFRSIIPEEFNKTYESARKWLLDNNIIGDKAKPFGMGYRIPTQGMSSMFAF